MSERLTSDLGRAKTYVHSKGIDLELEVPIGYGMDGSIWRASRPSVLKVFEREKNYRDEVECYRRFAAKQVEAIAGLVIPDLVDCDDGLLVLEMSVVQPPFLLDFGKVYLDTPPPYWNDAEIMGNWHAEGRENFGDRWKLVLSAIRVLGSHGIDDADPKPGNITFADGSGRANRRLTPPGDSAYPVGFSPKSRSGNQLGFDPWPFPSASSPILAPACGGRTMRCEPNSSRRARSAAP